MTDLAIETCGLGKRYGTAWALHDCDLAIPTGRVSGLVGANGAGKSTLIRQLAGLSRPTTGHALVDGRAPEDTELFLRSIGYLAQDVPLYRRWTATDHLSLGAAMNPTWNPAGAVERLRSLDIPLDRRIEHLSGGMRAQVALAIAMGKHPRILLLDEPVAALDPLARRDFLASLAVAVADEPLTVLLSSHLLPDLERICDHLIVMADGAPVLVGDLDEILADHKLVSAPSDAFTALAVAHEVISEERHDRMVAAILRLDGPIFDPACNVHDLTLEEIVLAYLARQQTDPARPLSIVGAGR